MRTISALGFLVLASARNAARVAFRRLRNPRHAFAALFGAAWLLFIFHSHRASIEGGARFRDVDALRISAGDAAWGVELVFLVLLCGVALGFWLFGRDEAALGFTEAEIQLLFPAPLTRRQLLAYKLAKGALATLAAVVVLALLLGRGGLGARLVSALAGWIALTTYSLHVTGAGLTRAALVQHGIHALRRRVLTLGVMGLAVLAIAVGLYRAPPLDAFPSGVAGLLAWSHAVLDTEPLSWALYPMRASLDLAFAPGTASLTTAGVALAALVVHVAWVFSSDAAFEESALDRARRVVRRLEAIRGAGFAIHRRSRHRMFRLGASGRPEAAFAWKAWIRATRFVSMQTIATVLVCLGVPIGAALAAFKTGEVARPCAILSVLLYCVVVASGPFVATGDLRRDLPHLEILRGLPVRGREIIWGEIALPLAQITAVQWVLLTIATSLSRYLLTLCLGERLAIAVALAIVGPATSAIGLLVHNGLVVLYPSWFPRPGELPMSRLSLDQIGRPIMLAVAMSVVFVFALVPAGIASAVAFLVLRGWLGAYAIPFAAAVAASIIGASFALGTVALGQAFDRLEPEG